MTSLAEDPLLIVMVGAVCLTFAVIVYLQLRKTWSLGLVVAVIALTGALLIAERMLVTPREAVLETLYSLADAVESNDLPATLSYVSPAAIETRAEIEALLPRFKIVKANVTGSPEVSVAMQASPPTATARFRGFIDVTDKRTGMKGGYFDLLEVRFVRNGERWLMEQYTTETNWRRAAGIGPTKRP